MKVGLFFGTFAGGGAERMMINLAIGLKRSGVEVVIYVVNKTGVLLKDIPPSIKVYDYQSSRGAYSVIHKIRATLINDKLDALISTQEHINACVALASIGLKTSTKVIFREANNPQQKKVSAWRRYLNKRLYLLADHHVAVSGGVKGSMMNYYHLDDEAISVIYNPVVDESMPMMLADEKTDDHHWFNDNHDIPVIVGMGRFHSQKGFDDLIEAFALVRSKRPAKLVIFGDKDKNTDYYFYLKKKVESLKLEGEVDFPGFVSNPFKYLAKASLFVLASKYEGLPGVLIQALACGCPVVSTDCPSGPKEILGNNEYGKLVPVSSPRLLSEAISHSLKEKPETKKLKQRAAEFSVEQAVQSYLALIGNMKNIKYESREQYINPDKAAI